MIIFIIIIFTDFTANDEAGHHTKSTMSKMTQDKNQTKSKGGSAANNEYTNPFGDSIQQQELDDENFINYIHKMSHQKVSADEKWGFYQITDERVKWLFNGLDKTKQTLKHSELYRSILKRWTDGDFSNVVNDHNDLWQIQGGSIGKAEGKLSKEQEEAYIRKNKDKE